MKLKTVLIEDEPNARALLKGLLEEYVPIVEIQGEAGNVTDAIELIRRHKPDLVFLDLELMGKDGWSVLDYFEGFDFHVIITTAYEQYALKSYKYGVVDYLLKPLTPGNLKKAVARAEKYVQGHVAPQPLQGEKSEIKIQTQAGFRYIPVERIIHLEASRNYTWMHLQGENPILISKTLSTLEAQLNAHQFLRIHHSHLINPAFLHLFDRQTGMLSLTDGKELPVSRERKKSIMEYLARR